MKQVSLHGELYEVQNISYHKGQYTCDARKHRTGQAIRRKEILHALGRKLMSTRYKRREDGRQNDEILYSKYLGQR